MNAGVHCGSRSRNQASWASPVSKNRTLPVVWSRRSSNASAEHGPFPSAKWCSTLKHETTSNGASTAARNSEHSPWLTRPGSMAKTASPSTIAVGSSSIPWASRPRPRISLTYQP